MDEASTSLKQAAEPVHQSTLQLTKNLEATSAQMNTLANVNRITRDNLSDLSDKPRTFVNNFNGIASKFEESTEIIKRSLDNYNVKTSKELSDALTKFSNTMTKALSGLEESVGDFSEAVGYVKQKYRR